MKISDAAVFRRFWYPVVPEAMLALEPRPLSLFGEDMVLWRGDDGTASALRDECSHQAVRLSLGCVRGSRLICPQHHWEFDRSGRCARMPQRPELTPPPSTQVRSHHVAQRYGLVWVAVEEPLAPIPDLPELEAPSLRIVQTLHERWKVSLPRFAENWLEARLDAQVAAWHAVQPASDATTSSEIRFVSVPRSISDATGTRCTATWWAPNFHALHLVHPGGLRQTVITAAVPLSDRWTVVTRLQVRSDSEADMPAADVIAADRTIAAAQRQHLEELPADVPLLPGEAMGHDVPPSPAGWAARERLRCIVDADGPC